MLINAAISAERNVINEKPTIFSKRMWDVKKKSHTSRNTGN